MSAAALGTAAAPYSTAASSLAHGVRWLSAAWVVTRRQTLDRCVLFKLLGDPLLALGLRNAVEPEAPMRGAPDEELARRTHVRGMPPCRRTFAVP